MRQIRGTTNSEGSFAIEFFFDLSCHEFFYTVQGHAGRRQVVSRVFPVLLDAFAAAGADKRAVVLYPSEEIRALLEKLKAQSPVGARVELRAASQETIGAAAVLTASGTMSLECALAGIPGALTYRTDWLTYLLGRLLVKVDHIGIANLLLKEAMYPEYLQGAATPAALAAELQDCLSSSERAARTRAQAQRLRELLHAPTKGSAADWMRRQLAG